MAAIFYTFNVLNTSWELSDENIRWTSLKHPENILRTSREYVKNIQKHLLTSREHPKTSVNIWKHLKRSEDTFWSHLRMSILAVSNCPTIVYSQSGSVNVSWYLVSLYLLKILVRDFIKLMWKVSAGEYFQSVFKSANLNLSAPIFKTLFMRHSQRAQCLPS